VSIAAPCALLFGLPTSRTYFEAGARGDALFDYMKLTLRDGGPEDVWNARYQRTVAAAQSLIEVATELAVAVYPAATLADFAAASRRHRVLVVLAHWKGAEVCSWDLRGEPATMSTLIERSPDPVLQAINPVVSRGGAVQVAEELVAAFNVAIDSGRLLSLLPRDLGDSVRNLALLSQALGRDLIDEALGDLIVPGNRLELFDGLHTPHAIESALDAAFQGEIDLSACKSEPLATYLKRRRGDRLHVLFTTELLDPLSCYIVIEHALKQWAMARDSVGASFISARLEIEHRLLEQLSRVERNAP
jgi:hypothetical protein